MTERPLDAKLKFLLALSSLAGATLILLCTSRYGAGLSPDSTEYIAVARNLLAGEGVVDISGKPFTVQPPLYPALLGVVGRVFRSDPLAAARIVNAVLFGLMVYLSGVLFFRHTGSGVLAGAGILLLARSLVYVSVMAWSEPLFILLVVLFFLCVESYLVRRSVGLLLLLSILAGSVSLTRYIGVTLIASGLLVILVWGRTVPRVRLLHPALFAAVSFAPLGVWILRNHALSGTFFGPRSPSQFTLVDNALLTIRGIFSGLVPERVLQYRGVPAALTAAAILVLGCVLVRRRRGASHDDRVRQAAVFSRPGPLALFVAVYTAFLLVTATTTAYDPIGIRLLSPIFVPAAALLLRGVRRLADLMEQRFSRKTVRGVLLAAAVVVLLPSLASAVRNGVLYVTQGAGGYNTDLWQQSETIRYLRGHTLQGDGPVYSNAPDVLYILVNVKARMSPSRTAYNSPAVVSSLSSLKSRWPETLKACLVWFDNAQRDYLYAFDELGTVAAVRETVRLADGRICTVSRSP